MNTAYVIENAKVMEQAQTLVAEGKRAEAVDLVKKQKDVSRDRAADGQSQALLDNANDLEELEANLADEKQADDAVMKAAGAAATETQYH
jgi:hypothetical protein